jgi:hypothetical protein
VRLTKPPMADQDNGPERPSHFHEDVNEYAPKNNTLLDYDDAVVQEELGFPVPPADPIGVYLTEKPPADRVIRKAFRATYSLSAAMGPQQLAGADTRRVRIFIRNNDADTTVLLRSKPSDGSPASFPLGPGQSTEEFHTDAVWAVNGTDGDSVVTSVGVLIEYEVED